jgi:hypothetical protein
MPSVPSYSIDEVDMSELNRIKRALMNASSTNMLKLTNKPDVDPTNGEADADLRKITEEIYKVVSSLEVFNDGLQMDREVLTFETFKIENITNVKENFKRNVKHSVTLASNMKDITRQLQSLAPNFNYVSLSTVTDFKEAFNELSAGYLEFSKTAKDITKFLIDDGLMNTKGYEQFSVEKKKKRKGKKGQIIEEGTGEYEDVFKPTITPKTVDEAVKEILIRNKYYTRYRNPETQDDLDKSNPPLDDVRITLDRIEAKAIDQALVETGADQVSNPSNYAQTFEIKNRPDADAQRRIEILELLNNEIKKINDPVAKNLNSIYSAFTLLRQVYEALIINFNEARVQVMPESADTQSTGTGAGTMEGGRLAHPSRKELAMYYASGLPKYI